MSVLLWAVAAQAVDPDSLVGRWESSAEDVTVALSLHGDATVTFEIITPDSRTASHGTWETAGDSLVIVVDRLTVDGHTASVDPTRQAWAVDFDGDRLTMTSADGAASLDLRRASDTAIRPARWGQVKQQ